MPSLFRTSSAFLVFLITLTLLGAVSLQGADDKWKGVDEAVVEKIAKEHGREARGPLIPTGDGDLLLFFFALAGAAGGFAAGYYWRKLTERSGHGKEYHDNA